MKYASRAMIVKQGLAVYGEGEVGLGELNAKLPAVFPTGFDWNKVYNSPTTVIFDLVIYARQCEAVLSQWVRSCVQCAMLIARHPSHHAFDRKALR
jgi:hypothetical protein